MAAANFSACLAFTLKWEGGKSNDPHDPGGRTNCGVTQATYNADRKARGLPPGDVFDMAPGERDSIYRRRYWDKIAGDGLPAAEDLALFDYAVNSGPSRACACRDRVCKGDVAPGEAAHRICAARLSFLQALRTWRYFGAGWGRRVAACEALCVRMAHGEAAAKPALINQAAKADRQSKTERVKAAGAAGAGAGVSAQPAVTGHHWIDAALFAGLVLALAALLFAAWRQTQRADAFKAEAASIPAPPRTMPPLAAQAA